MHLTNHFSYRLQIAFMAAILLSFTACSKDDFDDVPVDKYANCEYLDTAENLGSVQAFTIRSTATLAGYSQFSTYLNYSITVYKITYWTVFKGEPVLASGIISVPLGIKRPLDMVIVGNGLIMADRDAPSSFALPDNYTGFEFIASVGYIAIIPDMLGFGVSGDLVYPIHNYEYSATTMIDFIYACREFLECEKIETSGKNFMIGYSQGGYTAMATLKMLQEEHIDDINIEAAAVGAGGYNLPGILKYALDNNTYPSPAHLVMLFTSYNEIYGWGRTVNYFFREPYADKIPELLNGQYDRQQADDMLTTNFDDLFNPVFLQGLKDSTETAVYSALQENSVYDWAPEIPLTIIHSINDEKLPFSDSEDTYNKMVANGSTTVHLIATETEGHINAAMDFMEVVLQLIEDLK
jgi:pimeloyl-ACP methyl ester carboxylesterase